EAVDVSRPTPDAKGIALETTIACDPCQVMGDPDRLRQVMWNLLAHAVKFTPPKARVQVTLRRSGTDARVVVADTGQGIPLSFLPHVFERFRQVDTTSTRRHGGLGMRLAQRPHDRALPGGR